MPNRFTPINSKSDLQSALKQINSNFLQLDGETYSKTINRGGGKPAMVTGKLPNGRYGILLYDDTGIPRILIGQAPDNGRPGIWVSKENVDVLKSLE